MAKRWKLIGGAAVAVAVLGGGAAFAATQLDSPSARSQAIINDAAGQLGVQPDKLSSALQKALEDQLQAEVTAGQLTQAQADAQKKLIESGNYPLRRHRARLRARAPVARAATSGAVALAGSVRG